LLEGALAKIGPEPRLQSLLTIVKENVQRERLERKKTEFLQKAKESLRTKRYDSAIHTLESARSELRNEPEIDDLRVTIEERQREQAILEKLGSARRAQQGGDLQGALRELMLALAAYPGDQRFIQAKAVVEKELQQREGERPRERKTLQDEEERKKKEALEQKRIRAKREEQRAREVLEQQRQGVIRAQEEKDYVDSEKHRAEKQHGEQPPLCQEDRPSKRS
jgi:hypothetical protein